MLPFKLIYHDGYDLNLGAHVFPSKKYRLIRDRLVSDGFAAPEDFVEPEPATDEDLLLVHQRGWITRLKNGTLDYLELMKLEIPYSHKMVEAFWLAAGGTTLAARLALKSGIGFNIGGGFHHAFPEHGEGFCAIHDVAIAIRALQHQRAIDKALVGHQPRPPTHCVGRIDGARPIRHRLRWVRHILVEGCSALFLRGFQ